LGGSEEGREPGWSAEAKEDDRGHDEGDADEGHSGRRGWEVTVFGGVWASDELVRTQFETDVGCAHKRERYGVIGGGRSCWTVPGKDPTSTGVAKSRRSLEENNIGVLCFVWFGFMLQMSGFGIPLGIWGQVRGAV
jgi:hypothetical protein